MSGWMTSAAIRVRRFIELLCFLGATQFPDAAASCRIVDERLQTPLSRLRPLGAENPPRREAKIARWLHRVKLPCGFVRAKAGELARRELQLLLLLERVDPRFLLLP